jgi:ABC-type sugar transport system ATPase subunit
LLKEEKNLIELKNISKNLGDFKIKNINLNIEEGEYCVILGPTGAGKTIILELIAGILNPDQGALLINGKNVSNKPISTRDIGMLYQDYMLFPHYTVKKNIAYSLLLKSTNVLERLHAEMKRRTNVIRIFPNTQSCLRLIRAIGVETQEFWIERSRYLNMDFYREHIKSKIEFMSKKERLSA